MERNVSMEAIEQYVAMYQQSQQVQEPSMLWLVFVIGVVFFSGVGIIASVKFVYRFVKNGFKLKQPLVSTRYVFVDSAYGVAFLAALLSFVALFTIRAMAAGRGGF